MENSTNVLLEINHMCKGFEGLDVIKDISLSVKEGEVVSIIGPSGSGKSTLLRCATMLERMEGGELIYLGKKAVWEENGNVSTQEKRSLEKLEKTLALYFRISICFPITAL